MYHTITVAASGHLMVAEYDPPAIHVHSMQGDHLTTIQHREFELQGEDLIQGIRCSSDGLLHVATGVDCIDSLHAYKVGSGTDELSDDILSFLITYTSVTPFCLL